MRIHNAIVYILFVLFSFGTAQTNSDKGVKAGLCFSDWQGNDADTFSEQFSYLMEESGFSRFSLDKGYRFGFVFGGFISFKVNEHLSLQPELLYIMKGVKYDGGGFYEGYNVDMQLTYKTNYLEIPLLLRLSPSGENQTKPFLVFGPSVAYAMSSDVEVKVEIQGESEKDETKFEDLADIDYNLILGGGFVTSTGILFEFRYNMGMSSVIDAEDEVKIKNKTLSLSLGFHY